MEGYQPKGVDVPHINGNGNIDSDSNKHQIKLELPKPFKSATSNGTQRSVLKKSTAHNDKSMSQIRYEQNKENRREGSRLGGALGMLKSHKNNRHKAEVEEGEIVESPILAVARMKFNNAVKKTPNSIVRKRPLPARPLILEPKKLVSEQNPRSPQLSPHFIISSLLLSVNTLADAATLYPECFPRDELEPVPHRYITFQLCCPATPTKPISPMISGGIIPEPNDVIELIY